MFLHLETDDHEWGDFLAQWRKEINVARTHGEDGLADKLDEKLCALLDLIDYSENNASGEGRPHAAGKDDGHEQKA